MTCDSVKVGGNGSFFGAAYYYIDEVRVYDVTTSGISQMSDDNKKIILSPNPNTGNFTLSYKGTGKQMQVEVYGAMGQKIFNEQYTISKGVMTVDSLSEGIYFVKIYVDGKFIKTEKIIVSR